MVQPYMQLVIKDMAMRGVGNLIPSPLVSINLDNGESGLQTNFTAVLHIMGEASKSSHVGSFEMMLYEFAQMQGDSALPVSIEIGWADGSSVISSLKIQGLFIKFTATVKTGYMEYTLTGIGNFTSGGNIQGIALPAVNGNFQPSQVLEASLNYIQAYNVYDYDIDHDDEVVPINRPASVTSLGALVYGNGDHQGLIQQSYNEGSRSAAYGLSDGLNSGDLRAAGYTNDEIWNKLGEPISTTQRSASAYTFSIIDPSFYDRGVIRYKNNVNLSNYVSSEVLLWGGLETNILSISATYNGVTQQLLGTGASVQTGLAMGLDGSTIVSSSNRQNSYAASAASMYAAGNALNNLNAVSTQFNTDIKVTIVGNPKIYQCAESIRLIVYTGGSLNPITGVYRIMKVGHSINGTSYTTNLTLKRLDLITANSIASSAAGYSTGGMIGGRKIATSQGSTLDFGEPFQDITNLMRRGLV